MAVLTTALVWGYSPFTTYGKTHETILNLITCRVPGSPTPIVGLSAGKTPSSPLSHGLYHHVVNRNRRVIDSAESPYSAATDLPTPSGTKLSWSPTSPHITAHIERSELLKIAGLSRTDCRLCAAQMSAAASRRRMLRPMPEGGNTHVARLERIGSVLWNPFRVHSRSSTDS
jgi:hypothetical protein